MSLKEQYQLRDHQSHAVNTTLKRGGSIIFSHPVGSGKTLTSIAAFEGLKDDGEAKRVLVVTPASLRTNYGENGVKKFTDSDYVVYGNKQEIESDKTGLYKEPSEKNPEYGVVSYEMFREDPLKYINGHKADTVIFDEVHRIKNDESKTFKALKEHRGAFKNFIGMTGSITSNTPADVVPLIDAMTAGKHNLGSKSSFENRFVSTNKKGEKIVVNPILARALIAPYVHHVTEEQLEEGTGLKKPDKYVNEITIPLQGQHEDYYRYTINQIDPITKAKLLAGVGKLSKAELDAVFTKLLRARQVANSMATIDKNMSLEESAEKSVKVKRLLDDVESHIKDTPDAQVVIHSELINGGVDVLAAGLKKRGIEFGKFLGKGQPGVTEKSRQQDVNDYNAGKKKVLLISSAGGEGIDLPNTTLVASLDGHWNPEKINQVEARGIRMGGLSHRPEKDRKVQVNRYLTRLPLSNVDAFFKTKELIDPFNMVKRMLNREKVFYNPLQAMPTVDQLMYQVAKSKAKGNEQLKDLFHKTAGENRYLNKIAAYSYNSDKNILEDYLNEFQEPLLSGDYQDKYINEGRENSYINRLKKYYSQATKKDVVAVNPSQHDDFKDRSRLKNALIHAGWGAVSGGAVTALSTIPLQTTLYKAIPSVKGRVLAGLAINGIPALAGAVAMARLGDKPHVTTPAAMARKRLKLPDEDLLKILRGEAVKKEEIKTIDHFIRIK